MKNNDDLLNHFKHPAKKQKKYGYNIDKVYKLLKKERNLKEIYSKFIPIRLRRRIEEDPDAVLQGERRFVTVLFIDICNFTSISEKSSPDFIIVMINKIFDCVLGVVREYGGTVDKFLGDAALVLFGAIEAHKDDTVRALKAAKGIQAAIQKIDISSHGNNRKLKMDVSIGIHSGPVVAGTVGNEQRREYTVIGDTVNIAARLRERANPGEIIVSESICKQVSDKFDFTKLGKFKLRNRSEPLNIYLLGSHIQRSPVIEKKFKAPFLGRKNECLILNKLLEKVVTGKTQSILITGLSGIGKTRFIQEWVTKRNGHKKNVLWMEGHQEDRFFPFSTLFRFIESVFQERNIDHLNSSKSNKAWMNALNEKIILDKKELLESSKNWKNICSNDCFDVNIEQIESGMMAILKQIISSMIKKNTVVFVIDDYRDVDEKTQNVIELLKKQYENYPLLFIYITQNKKDVKVTIPHFIRLQGLGEESAISLITLIKNKLNLKDISVNSIYSTTGDYPLFIEMLMHHLYERSYLIKHKKDKLPGDLKQIVQARINDLSENLKRILEISAVLNFDFDEKMLMSLMSCHDIDVRYALNKLHELQYYSYNPVRHVYSFRQKLLKRYIYDSIIHSRRYKLHNKIAQYMVSNKDRFNSAQIAFHFEKSNDLISAVKFWKDAAEKANFEYNYDKAVMLYKHCLELIAEHSEFHLGEKWKLYIKLGQLYHIKNDLDHALQYFIKALETTYSRDDVSERAETLVKIGDIYADKGILIKAIEFYKKAFKVFQVLPTQELEVKTLNSMGIIYAQMGKWQEAEKAFLDGLIRAEELSDMQLQGMTNTNLGILFSMKGNWEEALSAYFSSLQCFEEAGIQEGVAQALHNLGMMKEEMNCLDEAENYYLKSIEVSRDIKDIVMIATSTLNRSQVRFKKGDLKTAEKLCEEILKNLERDKNPILVADAYLTLGQIYQASGKMKKAGGCLALSYRINHAVGNVLGESKASLEYGKNLLERKLKKRAALFLKKALSIYVKMNNKKYEKIINELLPLTERND